MNDTEPEAYEGDNSGWKILIHDPKDSPLIELRTHGTTLYRGWAKDIRIYMRQVGIDWMHAHKNKSDKPISAAIFTEAVQDTRH